MRESQSALAVKQLRRLDEDSRARIMRAEIYHEGLENIEGIIKPPRSSDLSNIYTYFPIQISNRSRFLDYARRQNRDLAAQHLRNCADLSDFHEFHSDCPNARAAASELVLLPTYPRYPTEEIARNIEVLRTHAATS
jgi:dTDP-4-amino-4,6-dideoxygalactose transaminase